MKSIRKYLVFEEKYKKWNDMVGNLIARSGDA